MSDNPTTLERSVPFELRSAEGDGLTLAGYAAVFNSPTRIDSWEGHFDETIARGAFSKTINARERVVVQFDHGKHPFFGSLPLGRIEQMREDDHGLYVEVRLSDNWFTQPIRDAIRDEAVTGMSFRFSVPEGGDDWRQGAEVQERTIREVKLYELGPVVFPAYADTSVGVRSALSLVDAADRAALLASTVSNVPTPDEGQDDTQPVPVTPDEGQRSTTSAEARTRALILKGVLT